MKKCFNKKLVMTKKDDDDFKNSAKCWICDVYFKSDVKLRDYCHVTEKYRGSAHKVCNIKVKLNHRIHILFHKIKIMIIIL